MLGPIKKQKVVEYFVCPFCDYEHEKEETVSMHVTTCVKNPANINCVVCEDFCRNCQHLMYSSSQKLCNDCSHNYNCRFKKGK